MIDLQDAPFMNLCHCVNILITTEEAKALNALIAKDELIPGTSTQYRSMLFAQGRIRTCDDECPYCFNGLAFKTTAKN